MAETTTVRCPICGEEATVPAEYEEVGRTWEFVEVDTEGRGLLSTSVDRKQDHGDHHFHAIYEMKTD